MKNKTVTWEDPLDHLVNSFSDEQMRLWNLHLNQQKIKCVTTRKLLNKQEIVEESLKYFDWASRSTKTLSRKK